MGRGAETRRIHGQLPCAVPWGERELRCWRGGTVAQQSPGEVSFGLTGVRSKPLRDGGGGTVQAPGRELAAGRERTQSRWGLRGVDAGAVGERRA